MSVTDAVLIMICVVRSGKMNQFEEALGLLMLCCLRSVEVGPGMPSLIQKPWGTHGTPVLSKTMYWLELPYVLRKGTRVLFTTCAAARCLVGHGLVGPVMMP
jgi:hypothetical protein